MTVHATAAQLAAYAGADPAELDDATVWALEAHLETCPACQARLGEVARPDLTALLTGVHAMIGQAVDAGPPPARRRAWRRPLHRWSSFAVLPWIAMTCAALLAAVLLDTTYPQRPSLVLLLAPLAPLAGMAAAWSRRSDPAWETIVGTARSGIELLLRRTAGVLAVVIVALSLAGWYVGASPALWLLPSLAFTAGTVLLGGWIGIARAAVVLGGAWLAVVVTPAVVSADVPVLMTPQSRVWWLVVAAVLMIGVVLRARDHQLSRSWT